MINDQADNEMMSVRTYANQRGVSYEAVRKQLSRYSDLLDEHITVQGKTRYLDAEAREILDSKRMQQPICVANTQHMQEVAELKNEIEQLKNELLAEKDLTSQEKDLKDKLKDELMTVMQEKIALETRMTALEKTNESVNSELEEKQKHAKELEDDIKGLSLQIDELKAENAKYVPYKTLFGKTRYKKVE